MLRTCLAVCAAAVLAAVLVAASRARLREPFATPEAHDLFNASRAVFTQAPNATFSDFKLRIPRADPVLYTDVRGLWRGGRLSPDSVQSVM